MDHQPSPFLVHSNGNNSNGTTHELGIFGTPPSNRYRRNSLTPLFARDDSGVYEGSSEKYINDPIHVRIKVSCGRFICLSFVLYHMRVWLSFSTRSPTVPPLVEPLCTMLPSP